MNIFMVVLFEPVIEGEDNPVWGILENEWPHGRHYIINNTTAFIAPRGQSMRQGDISDILGIDDKEEVTGTVVKYDNYSFYADKDFIKWIDKHR